MKRNRFPKGWNEARVRRVLAHYESQTEADAVREDEAAYRRRTVMEVPVELVPVVRSLIGLMPGTRMAAVLDKNTSAANARVLKPKGRK